MGFLCALGLVLVGMTQTVRAQTTAGEDAPPTENAAGEISASEDDAAGEDAAGENDAVPEPNQDAESDPNTLPETEETHADGSSDGGADTDSAPAPPNPATADNPSYALTMEALPAKYALALVGDPDGGLIRFASQLDAALEEQGLVRVRDPRLRTALLGEPASEGLPRSLSEARDALGADERSEALETIARITGADAVLLVQRAEPNVMVYDAAAGAFFRNARNDSAFIARAVRAAAARRGTSPAAAARSVEPPPPPPAERPARRFFRKNWPYFVGGLLLAGALTWIIVESRREDPPPQLILRIRPGP